MKVFACGDVIPDCEELVRGETDEDVLRLVAEHARNGHGIDPVPEAVVAQVRRRIRDEDLRDTGS